MEKLHEKARRLFQSVSIGKKGCGDDRPKTAENTCACFEEAGDEEKKTLEKRTGQEQRGCWPVAGQERHGPSNSMTKYSGLLKAKLQELLTARGLPVDGTKEVLIERLEESDKIAAELDQDDDDGEDTSAAGAGPTAAASAEVVAEPAAEEKKAEDAAPVEAAETPAAAGEAVQEEKKPEEKEEEKKPEVTPETLKAAAVEHLTKKIARAQKFGEDQQATTLQADLARIEKFGLALDSAIARELGLAPAPQKRAAPAGPGAHKKPKPNKKPVPRHNTPGQGAPRREREADRFYPAGPRRGGYGSSSNGSRHTHNGRIYKTRY